MIVTRHMPECALLIRATPSMVGIFMANRNPAMGAGSLACHAEPAQFVGKI